MLARPSQRGGGDTSAEGGVDEHLPLAPSVVRGDGGDDSSTTSLEEQEFADMERLMEELDNAAVSSGGM